VLIYSILYKHIEINNVLDNWYGCRPNSSTEKASFKLIEKILTALNNKQVVGGIFCDLQKHLIVSVMTYLLQNWSFMESQGKLGALIKSYLKARYQRVDLNTNNSINSFSSK
jgi:hypothetical protein